MIQKAELNDLPQIIEILNDVLIQMNQKQKINQWNETYPNLEVLKQDINNQNLYILKDENIILGIVALTTEEFENLTNLKYKYKEDYLVIHRFFTNVKLKRKNLGSLFIQDIEDFLKKKNYKKIRVDTFKTNIPMNQLLLKNNYELIGEKEVFNDGRIWNFYEKKLV